MNDLTLKNRFIKLSNAEMQSKFSRVRWAEGLILQLPKEHEGRNSWLLNYGNGEEAKKIREKHKVKMTRFGHAELANNRGNPNGG